jgi:hypothetical protein
MLADGIGAAAKEGLRHVPLAALVSSYTTCPCFSGGKATVARMFVNNANGQRGLVCQYDVVCFDEISGVSFDQKDGVNIMKGYMGAGVGIADRVGVPQAGQGTTEAHRFGGVS